MRLSVRTFIRKPTEYINKPLELTRYGVIVARLVPVEYEVVLPVKRVKNAKPKSVVCKHGSMPYLCRFFECRKS